jgi:hypothetical protein
MPSLSVRPHHRSELLTEIVIMGCRRPRRFRHVRADCPFAKSSTSVAIKHLRLQDAVSDAYWTDEMDAAIRGARRSMSTQEFPRQMSRKRHFRTDEWP